MVTLLMFHRLVREHASHLVYHESSSVKSCLSLRTCSVLFQLMSTAGPLARCSEFNERNDHGGIFSSFLSFFFFFAQHKRGQKALQGNWWKISTFFISPSQKHSIFRVYLVRDNIVQHTLSKSHTSWSSEGWELCVNWVWRHPENVVYLMYNIWYLTHFRRNNLNNSTLKLNFLWCSSHSVGLKQQCV